MRKFNLLIALLSVFSLTLSSCGEDVDTWPKPEPGPVGPIEQSFDIQITELTHNSVEVIVTPTDLEGDYLCMLYDAATVEDFTKDEYLILTLYQELEADARTVGMTLAEYLPQYLDKGVTTSKFASLDAESDYYIIVVGVDAAKDYEASKNVFKKKFTTAEAPVIEVTFDVAAEVDGTNAKIKVTPSDEKAIWFYTLVPSATYAQYLDPTMYGLTPEQVIEGLYQDQLNQLMNNGKSIKEAINETFHIGPLEFNVSYLVYNTEYTNIIAGFIIDQDANITLATDVFTSTFSTGDIGEVDLSFDITVTDIEPMRAAIKVVPSDLTQTFYWQIGEWDGVSTAEEVLSTVMPYNPYTGVQDYTGGPGSPYKMTLDSPDTDYYVIAFGYAPGAGITTEPTMVTFRTLPAPPAEETTFDVSVNAVSVSPYGFTFNVSPSANYTYYFMGIAVEGTFDAEATINEYNAAIDQLLLDYQEYYGPSYSMAQLLASSYYRGGYDNIPVDELQPGTTYMLYIAALDVTTGHVAKLHTFDNLVTTKVLGDARPSIVSLQHYSGRDEAGTIFGNAALTETKAIIAVEFGNLDNARSLFAYLTEGDATNIQEISDAYIWKIIGGYWDSVSIKQPYMFYVCSWDAVQTIIAYVVDKSGNPGLMTRQLVTPTLDTKGDIEELRSLVNSLNSTQSSATRLSMPASLVVAE